MFWKGMITHGMMFARVSTWYRLCMSAGHVPQKVLVNDWRRRQSL